MRIVVAVNPSSAFGKHGGVGGHVADTLTASGNEVVLLQRNSFQELTEAVADALGGPTDALVVVGGDGMVSLGVNAVAEREISLGIIAAGTGNDMARGLGLPRTPDESLLSLLNLLDQSPRILDAARVRRSDGSTRWYGGVLSAGFDALVNERANRMRFPKGPSKYVCAVLLELAKLRARSYRLTVDGVAHDGDAVLIAVGNNTSLGGGMVLTPHARLDDGQLDVVIGRKMSRLSLLRLLPKVFRGTHIGHHLVEELRGRHIVIDTPGVVAYADGEALGALPLEIEVVPGALRVYAPA